MKLHPSHKALVTGGGRCLGCNKLLYPFEGQAQRAADRHTLTFGPTWPYRCPFGLGWHMTSQPQHDLRSPTGTRATRKKKEAVRRKKLRARLGITLPEHQPSQGVDQ